MDQMVSEAFSVSDPAVGATVEAAGHHTHYLEAGSGPPVVLLHGAGPGVSAWSNWAPVIPELARSHRVIAPDIPGFGASGFDFDVEYGIKYWVAHLCDFLAAVGVEHAALVGNSFGGALALATSVSHPDRVDRLVLMGTPAGEFQPTEGLRAGANYEPSRENMEAMLRRFPYDPSLVTPEMIDLRYEASVRPGAQEALRKLVPAPPAEGEEAVVRGVPERALEKITAPALIVHGREDRVVPHELGLLVHRCIPDSQLHMFGRCGHWVQLERQEEFTALVLGFLAAGS